MSSIFTKIIKGEIPSYKIHEDDLTYSFLAIPANQLGHTLVIPKEEIDYFINVPRELYLKVMENVHLIATAIDQAIDCKRVGTMIQGLEVPHFHCHIIPINEASDMNFSHAKHLSKKTMYDIQAKIIDHL